MGLIWRMVEDDRLMDEAQALAPASPASEHGAA